MDKDIRQMDQESSSPRNFIEEIIEEDIANGKNNGEVHTRFPPEPNGYLHIGHAKAICLDFGLAEKYNGKCNLRFDDSNPLKATKEYVDSIIEDVHWLGYDWGDRMYYASDYFEQLYEWAERLIQNGKAYVCNMSPEEIKATRGTPTEPGKESPSRNRPVEENLELFRRMRNGEFEEGAYLLRAKIDMASPNMHLRDPVMYRIRYGEHHRTGNKWCVYPTYDFTHGQSDYIENITHSLCTLEFEVHRPLYEWYLDQLYDTGNRPRQIEFARLNIGYTVLSKRKLQRLVQEGHVESWDDPRMPTISGLRRRGYTPESIKSFSDKIGIAKREGIIDMALLEHSIREELNKKAARVMAVLDPVKVIIENYPEGEEEWLETVNNPEDDSMGTRNIPFSREIYIERNDFMEDPPRKFFRMAPGKEVRLKSAYIVECKEVVKDEQTGEIQSIICTYDPETKSGGAQSTRKVKGTLHWVSANHAVPVEVREYDRLFNKENPDDTEEGNDFISNLNPNSMNISQAMAESGLKDATPGTHSQFQRIGYYCVDTKHSAPGKPVFNRTVTLKDNWQKKVGNKQSQQKK
jgi:glutaminyl-tRNA synthetase